MPTPGEDDLADPGPPSVAQQNEAVIPTHAIQSNLPVSSDLATRGNIAENWKRWKQVWDIFQNRISPQPAGKPNTRGNIYYMHWIRRVRSLQFSAV